MIKFKMLIHKETGTVIKYEDWLEKYKKCEPIKIKEYIYGANGVIFCGDFEIVYDSEFTAEELGTIKEHIIVDRELRIKVKELIGEREYLNNKYNIDL